jgi:predicted ester cyclase
VGCGPTETSSSRTSSTPPTFLQNGVERTPETFATGAAWFRSRFEGFSATVDRIFACGDAAVTRIVYTATHAQDFPGVPATGARVEVTGLDVFRFEDGRVVEHLHEADHEAMWEQLGVRLPPGSRERTPARGLDCRTQAVNNSWKRTILLSRPRTQSALGQHLQSGILRSRCRRRTRPDVRHPRCDVLTHVLHQVHFDLLTRAPAHRVGVRGDIIALRSS